MAITLNALNPVANINSHVELVNKAGKGVINPEDFYSKQLLDTIRMDASHYKYHGLADEAPIQEKADQLMLRRWAPLQAHTVPLAEGVPPMSDKGSVEKYTVSAEQYGRYMEFSDKVDFAVVDPVIAHYTREYSLVAMETLDLLAKEALLAAAQKYYAGGAANFSALTVESTPRLVDFRLIVLSMKKALVKPRMNGKYLVVGSAEFFYDMISDPIVEKYMTINQTTNPMYDTTSLPSMFGLEFTETLVCPTSSEFVMDGKVHRRVFRKKLNGDYEYRNVAEDALVGGQPIVTTVNGYVKDARTGQDASYIPDQKVWDIEGWNAENKGADTDFVEFKAQHILVVGKDALLRTGLTGEGQVKVFVKQKGSAGVLDPIDQRQSIGFKINSVGYGVLRTEAVCDYICVPTQVNIQ